MATQTSTVSLNTDYLKSKQGTLRILEAVIGLCGIICVSQGSYCGHYGMYNFYYSVVVTTLVLAITILIVYVLGIDKMCTFVNFFLTALLFDALFSILYLIATILMIVTIGACRYGQVARIFATLFGVCGVIDVGLLALMGYQSLRSSSAPKADGV